MKHEEFIQKGLSEVAAKFFSSEAQSGRTYGSEGGAIGDIFTLKEWGTPVTWELGSGTDKRTGEWLPIICDGDVSRTSAPALCGTTKINKYFPKPTKTDDNGEYLPVTRKDGGITTYIKDFEKYEILVLPHTSDELPLAIQKLFGKKLIRIATADDCGPKSNRTYHLFALVEE